MKKLLFIAIIAIATFSSCTRRENINTQIISDKNVTMEDISDSLLVIAADSTRYNSNVVMSKDSKTAYVFQMKNGEQVLSHKMTSEGETEILSWGLFFMAVILILLLL